MRGPSFQEMEMNIYVGNLSYNASEGDLQQAFEDFGEVLSARIITDRATGKSKGFGFVEFEKVLEAKETMELLNGKMIKGKLLTVKPAEEQQR